MPISVLFFGSLAEIAGSALTIEEIEDLHGLELELIKRFPLLKGKEYALAVNQRVVNENVLLDDNSTVALLPPFAGG
ncbi:MAG: MoaD/ThiS family protein [Niabella sp.]